MPLPKPEKPFHYGSQEEPAKPLYEFPRPGYVFMIRGRAGGEAYHTRRCRKLGSRRTPRETKLQVALLAKRNLCTECAATPHGSKISDYTQPSAVPA